MLIAPSGPTCWSGTRVPGRPLLVACCSSSSTLRDVIVGVVSGLSGRVVGSAPPGATPSGAVCGRFWPRVAPPGSCPARPARPCAAPAVPDPGAAPPPAGVAPVGAGRAPGAAKPVWSGPSCRPRGRVTAAEAKAVTLSPVPNSVVPPGVGVPNSRLATPEGTDHSASDSPNSPFAAASQMMTDTVSPTAILYPVGGVYFLKRSGKP